MRLIDADRLKRQVEGRSWRAKGKMVELIDNSPTAEPVKHGRWVPVTNGRGGFECSICHNYAPSYQDGVEWLSLYCPSCGAKMEPISASPENGQEGGSMTDYIDRQAAIDAVMALMPGLTTADGTGQFDAEIYREQELVVDIGQVLNDLPPAEVEPVKHGRWEYEIRNTIDSLHTYQQFRCSVCGMTYITNTPYCPNCGAKMEGEE